MFDSVSALGEDTVTSLANFILKGLFQLRSDSTAIAVVDNQVNSSWFLNLGSCVLRCCSLILVSKHSNVIYRTFLKFFE